MQASTKLENLPSLVIRQVLEFVSLQDRLAFSETNKNLNKRFEVVVARYHREHLIDGEQNCNALYQEVQVDTDKEINDRLCTLVGVKFTFETKDQGWASVDSSWSWIQAQFISENLAEAGLPEAPRTCLVENYKSKGYQIKSKLIDDPTLLGNLKCIRVYCRSEYPGWRIFCKKSKIELLYM